MNLNEYMNNNRNNNALNHVKTIVCVSRLTLSVQASFYHYCTPRSNEGPWTHVEIGFPSQKCEEIMEYAESPENPCGTVYGYVPVEIVEKLIEKHGGIKS